MTSQKCETVMSLWENNWMGSPSNYMTNQNKTKLCVSKWSKIRTSRPCFWPRFYLPILMVSAIPRGPSSWSGPKSPPLYKIMSNTWTTIMKKSRSKHSAAEQAIAGIKLILTPIWLFEASCSRNLIESSRERSNTTKCS